jgi:hypothetical protein
VHHDPARPGDAVVPADPVLHADPVLRPMPLDSAAPDAQALEAVPPRTADPQT